MGLKFHHQCPLFGVILDFYCQKVHLGIALDGDILRGPEQIELDQERTRILNESGIEIMRFLNDEVINHIDDVLIEIKQTAENRFKSVSSIQPE